MQVKLLVTVDVPYLKQITNEERNVIENRVLDNVSVALAESEEALSFYGSTINIKVINED